MVLVTVFGVRSHVGVFKYVQKYPGRAGMTALIEKEDRGCEATTGIKLFAGSANLTQVSGLTDADTQNAVPTHHL